MLANGSVLITAGRDQVGDEVAEPEVWSSSGIRQLNNASLVLPYYPRTFVAPNGLVFYAGEQTTSRYLNTAGNGSWTTVGSRRYGARPYGSAVMYELGKILYVGGGRTTNTAEIIDLNAASPTWQWTGSMAFARRNLNATVLPTGEVLVTGGSSHPAFNDVTQAIRVAEMWNPASGVWTTMASNSVSRTYHSTSLLLPDGRVLHTGSGEGADMPEERNAELYSPPYLSHGARPTITDAPTLVGWGTTFSVQTPDAGNIAKVSLIRLGSVTHAFDMNGRLLWLSFSREAGSLTIAAPANGSQAPPGHYMLFLVNQNGVPSVARIVKVSAQSEPSPGPNAAPAAAFLAGCGALNCNFADKSSDPDGNLSEWQWSFGDGQTSSARDPSHAYGSGGSYTVRLTAKDSEGETATATRQLTVPGPATPLGLTLTTSSTSTTQKVTLNWSRAQGSIVYIYRDGLVLQSSPNDGVQAVTKNASGAATYIFKVCEAATTICSNPATAQFAGGAPTTNAPPNAAFTPVCDAAGCLFSDGSGDTDGNVTAWRWDFGDGGSSTQRNPSHTFGSAGTYQVRLTVTDDRGGEGATTKQVSVGAPVNAPPTADLTWSCTALDCGFTDASSDGDGRHFDLGLDLRRRRYVERAEPLAHVRGGSHLHGVAHRDRRRRRPILRLEAGGGQRARLEREPGGRLHLQLHQPELRLHRSEHGCGRERTSVELELRGRRDLYGSELEPNLCFGRDLHRDAHRHGRRRRDAPALGVGHGHGAAASAAVFHHADDLRAHRRGEALHHAPVVRRDRQLGGSLSERQQGDDHPERRAAHHGAQVQGHRDMAGEGVSSREHDGVLAGAVHHAQQLRLAVNDQPA